MSLIKSISGIRGTIGGLVGDNLSPDDIISFVSAFSQKLKEDCSNLTEIRVVLGRDGRISGLAIYNLIKSILVFQGINVLLIDLASTPTLALTIKKKKAQGGIMISASHNPKEWNALKFFNQDGQFIDKKFGESILKKAKVKKYSYNEVDKLGKEIEVKDALEEHVKSILKLPLVKRNNVSKANFKIVVDGINSVGSLAISYLLKSLGVINFKVINSDVNGRFAHNPEPLAGNLKTLSKEVVKFKADLGIAVDPDVDRLAIIDEKGRYIGEEYSLVIVTDYVLSNYSKLGNKFRKNSVSNLSSSRALRDISEKYRANCYQSAVGEVNVVDFMKKYRAVIGGEGNGGIIYPYLHYSRDALVGIALLLSYLSLKKQRLSVLRDNLPNYYLIKDKLNLINKNSLNEIFLKIKEKLKQEKVKINETDGLKVDWSDSWLHLRASNTEPIIRAYVEAKSLKRAKEIVNKIKKIILPYIK